jgi:crystallin, alpha B
VPKQCNINQLKSSLSSDGVLMITVPRKEPDPQSKNERIIKIQITGQPALRKNSNLAETLKENQVQKNSVPQKEQEQTVKVA